MIKNADVKRFEKINGLELPKDTQSEEIVIGSILANPEFLFKLEYLKARMFYEAKFANIYYIVENLINKGIENIDSLMIENQIVSNKSFKDNFKDEEDIRKYIDLLKIEANSDISNVDFFAKNIVSCAFKRDSYIKLQEMGKSILSSDEDINDVNYSLQYNITKFADEYIVDEEFKPIGTKLDDIYKEIAEDRERGHIGIPMSTPYISNYFEMTPGSLTILGGRAKGGKSMWFLQEAIHKARMGVGVLFIDTEMDLKSWTIRALAHLSKVEMRKITLGEGLTDEEKMRLKSAETELKKLPITHVYMGSLDIPKIFMMSKKMIITKELGFIIVDYLKVSDTSNSSDNEYNMLGNMSIGLKNMASDLGIAILCGAQLHHKEDRLGDSSKITRYLTTQCIWTYKTAEEKINDGVKEGNCKMRITHNRVGMQTNDEEYLNFVFKPEIATIYEAETPLHTGNIPY